MLDIHATWNHWSAINSERLPDIFMCRISFNNNFETITFNMFPVTVFDGACSVFFFFFHRGLRTRPSRFRTWKTISRKKAKPNVYLVTAAGTRSSVRKIHSRKIHIVCNIIKITLKGKKTQKICFIPKKIFSYRDSCSAVIISFAIWLLPEDVLIFVRRVTFSHR